MSTNAKPFENSVIAALDICANRRAPGDTFSDTVGRTAAIIEEASDKLDAGDFSAVEAALASQALALDVIFDQFARRSASGDLLFHDAMRMALRAQSQSRVTFKNLTALKNPHASKNSAKRTVADPKVPA